MERHRRIGEKEFFKVPACSHGTFFLLIVAMINLFLYQPKNSEMEVSKLPGFECLRW